MNAPDYAVLNPVVRDAMGRIFPELASDLSNLDSEWASVDHPEFSEGMPTSEYFTHVLRPFLARNGNDQQVLARLRDLIEILFSVDEYLVFELSEMFEVLHAYDELGGMAPLREMTDSKLRGNDANS